MGEKEFPTWEELRKKNIKNMADESMPDWRREVIKQTNNDPAKIDK